MINVIRRLVVVGLIAGLLVLGAAVPVMAAPGPSGLSTQDWYRWHPSPNDRGNWWPGTSRLGLEYFLQYMPETGEIGLLVVNDTGKSVTVEFPASQQVDFVLWADGMPVWRWSADRAFSQVVTTETIEAGQVKVYKATLPWVPQGSYMVEAFFLAESRWQPVASTYIWVPGRQAVSYSVNFLGPSGWNPYPRLRVVVKNDSGRDIWLPYRYGYQVLVRRAGSGEYLPGVGLGDSIGYMQHGATRYVFVNLKGLEPGWYEADVRSNVATGYYVTVARTRFYVW